MAPAVAQIRPMAVADVDAVLQLRHAGLPDMRSGGDTEAEKLRHEITHHKALDVTLMVAEISNAVIGYAHCSVFHTDGGPIFHSASYYLNQLVVDERFQGSRIGSNLVDRCAKTARGRGHDFLFANVSDSSLGFYMKSGWTAIEAGLGVAWVDRESREDRAWAVEDAGPLSPCADFAALAVPRHQVLPAYPGIYNQFVFKSIGNSLRVPPWGFSCDADQDGFEASIDVLIDILTADPDMITALHPSTLVLLGPYIDRRLGSGQAQAMLRVWAGLDSNNLGEYIPSSSRIGFRKNR